MPAGNTSKKLLRLHKNSFTSEYLECKNIIDFVKKYKGKFQQ